jgi:lipid II isoglutaminyl synthase (glutamine-hydrolysing)
MTEKIPLPPEVKPDTAPLPAMRRPRRMRIRAAAAVMAGRATGIATRRLRFGGGTSLPGLVARAIDPHLSSYLSAQLRHGAVVITGTNGKTTTSGLVGCVFREGGLRVWRNREGSNLARGIATALLMRASAAGALHERGDAAFVFEVDEAAFPRVVADLKPRSIAITNLFRDQLDRYGEVDIVAERWRDSLQTLPPGATLALNADDPAVAALADSFAGDVIYFGVEDASDISAQAERVQTIDTRTCPRCRGMLVYSRRFYSHVGHWACPQCGFARPHPAVSARAIMLSSLDQSRFELSLPDGASPVVVALPGLYNVYNALAAAAVGSAAHLPADAIRRGISRFSPAFGRAERIEVNGRVCHILLAKNPTGINEVLRALTSDGARHHLLMLLNDRAADGEDVSWIWDADIEQAPPIATRIVTGGTRAYDLAIRLKYAGRAPDAVELDIGRALAVALEGTPMGETLYIIPTYTAMLAVRGELARQGFAPHYWEQEDA